MSRVQSSLSAAPFSSVASSELDHGGTTKLQQQQSEAVLWLKVKKRDPTEPGLAEKTGLL